MSVGLSVRLLHPAPDLKEVRGPDAVPDEDVQARGSEIEAAGEPAETAGIKSSSVVSDVTGASVMAMIEAPIDR